MDLCDTRCLAVISYHMILIASEVFGKNVWYSHTEPHIARAGITIAYDMIIL